MPHREAPRTPLAGGSPTRDEAREPGVQIGVFAKHWTPGQTKTRLAAAIGPTAAARVSKLFLEATLRRVGELKQDLEGDRAVALSLAFTPASRADEFAALPHLAADAWRVEPQGDGSLGARMRRFFDDATQHGSAALLVGSDSPHLPMTAFRNALTTLVEPGRRRAVFGPTGDGGYWLVGCRGETPPVFDDAMPWSQPTLLNASLERMRASGWREGADFRLVDEWYDIDEADDLSRLRGWLAAKPDTADEALIRLGQQLDSLLGEIAPDTP